MDENLRDLLRQWRGQGDEQEQRETFQQLQQALPEDFPQSMEDMYNQGEDPTGQLAPALCKALGDYFDYALGLRNGQVIRFQEASLRSGGKWLHLAGSDEKADLKFFGAEYNFPRGIDIRLSDIMWVADAPEGS